MEGDPELARDRLDEGDVVVRPAPHHRRVHGERPDHRVEEDDRRRENGTAAKLEQGLAPAQRIVVELWIALHVGDRSRRSLAQGKVRDRQKGRLARVHRLDSLAAPFGPQRRRTSGIPKTYEAALDIERLCRLGEGGVDQSVDVQLGANAARDVRHQALPLQPALERGDRLPTLESESSFAGEHSHQRELLGAEGLKLARRAGDKDADDPPLALEREEDHALQPLLLDQLGADIRRAGCVFDREDGPRLDGPPDARDLALEVVPGRREPFRVGTAGAADQSPGCSAVRIDEHQAREIETDQIVERIQHGARDALSVAGERQSGRELGNRRQLALPDGQLPGAPTAAQYEDVDQEMKDERNAENKRQNLQHAPEDPSIGKAGKLGQPGYIRGNHRKTMIDPLRRAERQSYDG